LIIAALTDNRLQNWPMSKKIKILAVISFATFTGFSACLAGQLQVVPQSKLYKVTTNQMAYQVRFKVSSYLKSLVQLTTNRTQQAPPAWLPVASSSSHCLT